MAHRKTKSHKSTPLTAKLSLFRFCTYGMYLVSLVFCIVCSACNEGFGRTVYSGTESSSAGDLGASDLLTAAGTSSSLRHPRRRLHLTDGDSQHVD